MIPRFFLCYYNPSTAKQTAGKSGPFMFLESGAASESIDIEFFHFYKDPRVDLQDTLKQAFNPNPKDAVGIERCVRKHPSLFICAFTDVLDKGEREGYNKVSILSVLNYATFAAAKTIHRGEYVDRSESNNSNQPNSIYLADQPGKRVATGSSLPGMVMLSGTPIATNALKSPSTTTADPKPPPGTP